MGKKKRARENPCHVQYIIWLIGEWHSWPDGATMQLKRETYRYELQYVNVKNGLLGFRQRIQKHRKALFSESLWFRENGLHAARLAFHRFMEFCKSAQGNVKRNRKTTYPLRRRNDKGYGRARAGNF